MIVVDTGDDDDVVVVDDDAIFPLAAAFVVVDIDDCDNNGYDALEKTLATSNSNEQRQDE